MYHLVDLWNDGHALMIIWSKHFSASDTFLQFGALLILYVYTYYCWWDHYVRYIYVFIYLFIYLFIIELYRRNLVTAGQQASTLYGSCCHFQRCSARWWCRSMCTVVHQTHEAVAVNTKLTTTQTNTNKLVSSIICCQGSVYLLLYLFHHFSVQT